MVGWSTLVRILGRPPLFDFLLFIVTIIEEPLSHLEKPVAAGTTIFHSVSTSMSTSMSIGRLPSTDRQKFIYANKKYKNEGCPSS